VSDPGSRLGQRGSATVAAALWMQSLLSIVWIGLIVAAATARQHDLDGAADLVALSAAAGRENGHDPCRRAETVARANDVRLVGCELVGDDVRVMLRAELELAAGSTWTIVAEARAGP